MSEMRAQIKKATEVLTGQPLWGLGRAVDLAWFQFGSRRLVKTFRGETKEVGDYALHVQCAWRIRREDKVIVGRGDIFSPPEETDEPLPEDFDWQKGNRFDTVVSSLFEQTKDFVVSGVEAGDAGTLTITLDHGLMIEVFPHDSLQGEHWRLFEPSKDKPHFVVSGKGLETE
jgi:hypothetical protein